jgi:hypothetical protein
VGSTACGCVSAGVDRSLRGGIRTTEAIGASVGVGGNATDDIISFSGSGTGELEGMTATGERLGIVVVAVVTLMESSLLVADCLWLMFSTTTTEDTSRVVRFRVDTATATPSSSTTKLMQSAIQTRVFRRVLS